jgi:hypothetical protein
MPSIFPLLTADNLLSISSVIGQYCISKPGYTQGEKKDPSAQRRSTLGGNGFLIVQRCYWDWHPAFVSSRYVGTLAQNNALAPQDACSRRRNTMEDFVLPMNSPVAMLATVGGKGANLSQLARAGFPVPSRFLISTAAYQAFVQENDLQKQIEALARSGTATNFEEVSLEQRQNACCVHCVIFWCVGCSSWGRATLPMSMTPPSTSSASWHLCRQPCLRPGSGSPTGEL